jgi:hypothetical protein
MSRSIDTIHDDLPLNTQISMSLCYDPDNEVYSYYANGRKLREFTYVRESDRKLDEETSMENPGHAQTAEKEDNSQPSIASFEHRYIMMIHRQHDLGECDRSTCPYCAYENYHKKFKEANS